MSVMPSVYQLGSRIPPQFSFKPHGSHCFGLPVDVLGRLVISLSLLESHLETLDFTRWLGLSPFPPEFCGYSFRLFQHGPLTP
jgi:hypothetical protein